MEQELLNENSEAIISSSSSLPLERMNEIAVNGPSKVIELGQENLYEIQKDGLIDALPRDIENSNNELNDSTLQLQPSTAQKSSNDSNKNSYEPTDIVHKDDEVSSRDSVEHRGVNVCEKVKDNVNIKKKRPFEDAIDLIDLEIFRTENTKRRVPGKFIDRFWETLDNNSMKTLDKILFTSLGKTIERYNIPVSKKFSKKMIEAQSIISRCWMNEEENLSFRSRLKATKLPLPSTVSSYSKKSDMPDVLSFDQLRRKKTLLETYLSAELKQLNELEQLYHNLETIHESDLKYLNEFKKTTSINLAKMRSDTNRKQQDVGLDMIGLNEDNISLHQVENSYTKFNPQTDESTKDILSRLNKHLSSMSSNTAGLTKLNEKLEVVHNILEML